MSIIATCEDALLERVETALGNTVREITSLPGGWTMDMLTRALQFAPGVYVGFGGLSRGQRQSHFDARFDLYVVTKGPREPQRRRGNPREIGSYEMVHTLLHSMALFSVPGVGAVRPAGVQNLFRDALFNLGGTVYGIELTVPNLAFDGSEASDATALADFITFDARYDLAPDNEGAPIAGDTVTLQTIEEP